MKKVIRRWRPFTAVAILGALALTLVSASGLWSDSQTISGNTVQAGSVTLDLRGLVNKPLSDSLVSGDIIHGVGGLLPGETTQPGKVEIYNDGTREQKQYLHVTNITGALCGYISLTLGRSFTSAVNFDETIGTMTLASINGPGNRISVGRTFSMGSGVVPDNFTTVLVQKATLSAATPNSFNGTGATCVWDEVFTAEQVGP